MCQYLFKNPVKEYVCDIHKIFSEQLPHDDNNFCIFHSRDLAWKESNNFKHYFKKFFGKCSTLEKDKVEVIGFEIIGEVFESPDNSFNDPPTLVFKNIVFHKDVYFNECTFHHHIHLVRSYFKGILYFQSCSFINSIEIEGVRFGNEINADSNVFHETLRVSDCSFDTLIISTNNFKNTLDLQRNVHNRNFALIDNAMDEDSFYQFAGDFHSMCNFSENADMRRVQFYDCNFWDEVEIQDLLPSCVFSLTLSKINNLFLLQGSEGELCFSPESAIEVSQNDFGNSGRIVFDYCNILNLKNSFFENLKSLESTDNIRINDTCEATRFRYLISYKSRDVNQQLFEDFNRLLTRFFADLYSIQLDVSFIRRVEKPVLDVIYSSRYSLPADFTNMVEEMLDKIDDNLDHFSDDIQHQYQQILERVSRKIIRGELNKGEAFKLLTLNQNVHITMNIKQKIEGNNNISNLLSDNNPSNIYNMVDSQAYNKAVADIQSNGDLSSEQIAQALDIIEDILDRFQKKEDVKPYLKDSLLSIAGNISSVVSFLNTIIPFG